MSESSQIALDFKVGWVSAIYFVFFDLILLTLVDSVLSKIACSLYYRRINAGEPILVTSADLPGITTFLVGKYTSMINISAIFIKLAFLACIVLIERGIDSEVIQNKTKIVRYGKFIFDPSDVEWVNAPHRLVSRRWEIQRRCRIVEDDGKTITFYSLAFNLSDNIQLINEIDNSDDSRLININDSTITCLSPRNVINESTRIVQKVIGCSQLIPTDCTNETVVTRNASSLKRKTTSDTAEVEAGAGKVSLSVDNYDNEEIYETFPEFKNNKDYNKPSFTCATTSIGTSSRFEMFRSCILVIEYQGNTLVERWSYNLDTLTISRDFPGPIFTGIINFGVIQRYNNLINIVGFGWETYASTLIADSMIYRFDEQTIHKFDDRLVTTVPIYAVALGIGLLALTIIVKIIIFFTIGKDERPPFNSINGLSYVCREEHEPTGRSLVTDNRRATLGIHLRGGTQRAHFGPVNTRTDRVLKRSEAGSMNLNQRKRGRRRKGKERDSDNYEDEEQVVEDIEYI